MRCDVWHIYGFICDIFFGHDVSLYAYLPFGQLFVIKNGMFVIGHISENY